MPKASEFVHVIGLLALFIAFTLVPSPISAQNAIQRNDRDGDGRLSRQEFPGPNQAFHRLDRDGDGFLTQDELGRTGGQRGSQSSPRTQQQKKPIQGQGQRQTQAPAAVRTVPARSGPARFVDTHMHLHPLGLDIAMGGGGRKGGGGRSRDGSGGTEADNLAKAADNLVSRMDRQGLSQALVVVVPSSKGTKENAYRTLRDAVRRHPDRLRLMAGGAVLGAMLLDTAPGAVTDDLKRRFRAAAEKALDEGAAGFGEMISYHLCMTQRHSFKKAMPNHPLYLLLADIAAERDVPIDIHMEAVETPAPVSARLLRACDKNPAELEPTIPAFEELLRHNRKARIVWQHIGWDNTGQMQLALLRRLLKAHPNLSLALRVPERVLDQGGRPIPNRIVDGNMRVTPEWKRFADEFQDRLVIGADEFIGPSTEPSKLAASFATTWSIVDQFPEAVARKIGGDNARRIYRLR